MCTGRLLACFLSYEVLWELTVKNCSFWNVTQCTEANERGEFYQRRRQLLRLQNVYGRRTIQGYWWLVERYWQRETEVLGEKDVAMERCPPQILQHVDIQIYRRRNVHAVPGCSENSVSFCHVKWRHTQEVSILTCQWWRLLRSYKGRGKWTSRK